MFGRRQEDDEQLVTYAMLELAQEPAADRPLPDPSFIWWKSIWARTGPLVSVPTWVRTCESRSAHSARASAIPG